MNRFIGLDGHSSSCTFAVLSEKGKTIRTDVVENSGDPLYRLCPLEEPNRRMILAI